MDDVKIRLIVSAAMVMAMPVVKIPEAEQNWYPPVAKRKRKKRMAKQWLRQIAKTLSYEDSVVCYVRTLPFSWRHQVICCWSMITLFVLACR